MTDNTVISPGIGGDTIRTVSKTATNAKTQVTLLDGGGGADGSPETIWTMGAAVTASSMPVTIASDQTVPVSLSGTPTVSISGTVPVSAASLPLPTGAAKETGGNLAAIATALSSTLPVSIASMPSTPVTGTFWQATQPVSGTVTANMQDGSGNATSSDQYNSAWYLHVDPSNATTDGAAYNSTNVPQIAVGAGKGADGNVHPISTDASGNQTVTGAGTAGTPAGGVLTVQGASAGQALPVSGSVTSNAGANLNTSALALESGGKLATVASTLVAATTTDAPLNVSITGDPNGDFAGVNILEQVVTDGTGLAINTRVLNPPKADAQGAAIPSDCVTVFSGFLSIGQFLLIDTQGYASIQVTATNPYVGAMTYAGDQVNWLQAYGYDPYAWNSISTTSIGRTITWPSFARYFRLTTTVAGYVTIILRAAPLLQAVQATNLSSISGNGAVTAGVVGLLAVGGNVAPGVARTSNPIPVSGVDAANITRTLLTDTVGRPQIAGVDTGGTPHAILTDTVGNVYVTMGSGTAAGPSVTELLQQLLAQEQANSLYLYNAVQLLYQLVTNTSASAVDEPDVLVADFLNPATTSALQN